MSKSEDEPEPKCVKTDATNTDKIQKGNNQRRDKTGAGNITPRDPLPDRVVRNNHPVAKKGVRRSTAEVEADRRAQADAIESQIRELQEAKRVIAAAHASEDNHLKHNMTDENPQRLSAALRKQARRNPEQNESEESGQEGDHDMESFDFSEADELLDSTSESDEPSEVLKVSPHLLAQLRARRNTDLDKSSQRRKVKQHESRVSCGRRFKGWWGRCTRENSNLKMQEGKQRGLRWRLSSSLISRCADSSLINRSSII